MFVVFFSSKARKMNLDFEVANILSGTDKKNKNQNTKNIMPR